MHIFYSRCHESGALSQLSRPSALRDRRRPASSTVLDPPPHTRHISMIMLYMLTHLVMMLSAVSGWDLPPWASDGSVDPTPSGRGLLARS